MAALRPSPQQFVENVVNVGKGVTGTDRLMVIRPATYLLVQLFNQDFLFPSLTAPKNGLGQGRFQGFQRFLGRLYDELSFEFTKCPAQHIKTVVDVGDDRLFLRQLQPSGLQKIADDCFGFFRNLLCRRCDNKIVGITHQIDLALVMDKCTDLTLGAQIEAVTQDFLHPIQRHVCEDRGNDAALRRTLIGGKQFLLKYKSCFQKLFQYRFVHGNVLNEPIMADVVKTPFDVALQYPLWGETAAECCENIFTGVLRTAPLAETKGLRVRRCLRYRVEG